MSGVNRVKISGVVLQCGEVRHTPAGIPVVELQIQHESVQVEAEMQRQVRLEADAVVIGPLAKMAATLRVDDKVAIGGFLAQKSQKNDRLVVHVSELQRIDC